MTKTFSGEYHHSLDTKGRLIVPAKFREILGSRFWIGKGFDQCLQIYDEEDWEAFSNSLKALPKNSDKARKLVRYFMSGTVEVEIDKQGRILLPAQLREIAGIDKTSCSSEWEQEESSGARKHTTLTRQRLRQKRSTAFRKSCSTADSRFKAENRWNFSTYRSFFRK